MRATRMVGFGGAVSQMPTMPPAGPIGHRKTRWCEDCLVSWWGLEPGCWFCGAPTENQTMPFKARHSHMQLEDSVAG